jgi:hypothetical protein
MKSRPHIWVAALIVLATVAGSTAAFVIGWGSGEVAQTQVILATTQALLAASVAIATVYYAKRTGDMVDLMKQRDIEERRREREGTVLALVGSSVAVAGYAAWLAELQRYASTGMRRVLPESPAQREFFIEGWRLLTSSVTAVSKDLETLRYREPDLSEAGGVLFDAVSSTVELASQGKVDSLLTRAAEIRQHANELLEAGLSPCAAQ